MHDLEGFRDRFQEAPQAKRPEDVDFPRDFLQRAYGIAAIGVLLITLTAFLHFHFPFILNRFYSDIHGKIQYSSFLIFCAVIVFAVGIPVLALSWKNHYTMKWMLSCLLVFCFAMGTVIAFICAPLKWNFITLPLLVCSLTFAMLSGWSYIFPSVAQGKYSLWATFISGFSLIYLSHTLASSNMASWIISFVLIMLPCYLFVNLTQLKRIAFQKNPAGMSENKKAFIGGSTLVFAFGQLLFPYIAWYDQRIKMDRDWVGAEDIPVDGPSRPL